MIPFKPFGRTGHESSRTIFGAASLGPVTQDEADKTLDILLDYGVNHIDTAASYGDSELRIGPWMREHRNDFFLATKTEERTYREAKEELYRSLDRLRVDHVDLWQMHVLVDPDEWKVAMNEGGALEAFVEAKEQGLVRFLGVTGHGTVTPSMHMKSLEKYSFDSVLLPYNFTMMQNVQYAKDFQLLIDVCKRKHIAVQTIKALARGLLGDKTTHRAVWYDPLEEKEAIEHSVSWVLGHPDVFLNTVGDIDLLVNVLESAADLQEKPSSDIMDQDVQEYGITPLFFENQVL